MIWYFYINNYLLGKEPFPFDILYWNADSTRLPASMHSYYLRNMYQHNLLSKANGLTLDGIQIDLRRINIPTYLLATKSDHIAPWQSTYKATQLYKGALRFVLSGSGHVAGIVNPPSKNKYSHWVNDSCQPTPELWLEAAEERQGSWWPDWISWLKPHSGNLIPCRKIKDGIEDAPGNYVRSH